MFNVIGLIAASLTMFAFFPQVIKIYRKKSAKDISLITLAQLSLGVILWIIYGVYKSDPIIIMANAITLFSLLLAIGLSFRYKNR